MSTRHPLDLEQQQFQGGAVEPRAKPYRDRTRDTNHPGGISPFCASHSRSRPSLAHYFFLSLLGFPLSFRASVDRVLSSAYSSTHGSSSLRYLCASVSISRRKSSNVIMYFLSSFELAFFLMPRMLYAILSGFHPLGSGNQTIGFNRPYAPFFATSIRALRKASIVVC